MRTITDVVSSGNKHSQQSHCAQDAGISLQENPTAAYLRNEELFSIDKGFQRTMDTSLLPVHCNSYGDMIAALKAGAKRVEIPDSVWQKVIEDSLATGHFDNPGEPGPNGADYLLNSPHLGLSDMDMLGAIRMCMLNEF